MGKREGRKDGKFRTEHNHFRSFTMAPLNLLRDCHFYGSADEDSSEIQFHLVFQPVGTSELAPFIPADLILPLSTCSRFPDPIALLHLPDHSPLGLRIISVRNLHLSPPPIFLPQTGWKIQAVHKEKRINMVECKIKFIPLQISVMSLTSRDSYIFVAITNPRDFDVFSNN